MQTIKQLQQITKDGLELLKKEKGIIEGLVYAAANERTIGRLVYTSHLPSNGLEEPKSDIDYGVTVEMWFEQKGRKLVGIGHEQNDLSLEGVKRAIVKARRDAVEDNDFSGFLKKEELPKKKIKSSRQVQIAKGLDLSLRDESEFLVKLSWETIEGAVDALIPYAKKHKLTPEKIAFILNGDNFIIKERMALATTTGIEEIDQTAIVLSFLTAMLERENAKGSSWGARLGLDNDFSAYEKGKQATLAAINGVDGVRVPSGKYRVVFGQQATTELFNNLFSPHVNLGMVELGASLFIGKYGEQVASPLLTIYDDATLHEGAGSRTITCEGYPTGKTLLIEAGKLIGYLSDSRTTNKILQKKEHGKMVLGVDPHEIRQAISPRNGFRFARGGGRSAASGVGIHATNLVIDSPKPVSPEKLVKEVKDGIFIGRLWYTYPIGGYASGIITGTAIADCYIIKNGKLAEPIAPNTLRIEDHIGEMAKRIIGVGNNQTQTSDWLAGEITHAPWVGIDEVQFYAINEK